MSRQTSRPAPKRDPQAVERGIPVAGLLALALIVSACTTLPAPRFSKHKFPKDAYVGDVKRPYVKLGLVRSRVDYPSLDPNREEAALCRNYYNKAVSDLVKRAKDNGGDAVIDIKSVVFLEDGRQELHPTPECSDDGEEGQILLQGVAVKWVTEEGAKETGKEEGKSGAPTEAPVPASRAGKATSAPPAPNALPSSFDDDE